MNPAHTITIDISTKYENPRKALMSLDPSSDARKPSCGELKITCIAAKPKERLANMKSKGANRFKRYELVCS